MTLVRTKTSEAVAGHILGLLFDGTLRTGDRIDIDGIATSLGVSRVPVREGLMSLERDGLVRMPHYRGAFVAGFDAGTVFEAFELYAMLSALTNRRAAAKADTEVLESLEKLDDAIQRSSTVDEFERLAREFRRVVNVSAAGNHLRALLRTFSGLVPAAARFAIEDALSAERDALRAEYLALRAGDPDAAGHAALDHIRMTAANAVAALRRRGVFPETDGDGDPSHDDLTAILDRSGG